jgi:hypothetical protein
MGSIALLVAGVFMSVSFFVTVLFVPALPHLGANGFGPGEWIVMLMLATFCAAVFAIAASLRYLRGEGRHSLMWAWIADAVLIASLVAWKFLL